MGDFLHISDPALVELILRSSWEEGKDVTTMSCIPDSLQRHLSPAAVAVTNNLLVVMLCDLQQVLKIFKQVMLISLNKCKQKLISTGNYTLLFYCQS